MAMQLEGFCNAFSAFLGHAEDINLWPTVNKLNALQTDEASQSNGNVPGKLQMDPNDGISPEFMEIKMYGLHVRQEFPQTVGQRPENREKNRYRDILPFDKCRVVIDKADTYINASVIEGINSCCSYIAAQGPLPKQACDFWRMVIRYQCPAIVMLCDLVEGGRSKCSQYWPDVLGKPHVFDTVTVTLVSEERLINAACPQPNLYTPICRIFELYTPGDDGRPVVSRCRQYQMNGWPDHGVPPPSAITSLIDLAAILIQNFPPSASRLTGDSINPLLIHCSAGCGRTGVFIALHEICTLLKLHQLDANVLSSGLLDIVKSLRYQRPAMVQTFDQYVFLYQVVATLLRRVSRMCLRRLAKLGVSLVSDAPENNMPANSPSPPPPKPPDPFGGSNGSLQKSTPLPPAQGRQLAIDLAADLVQAFRSSDWAVLRRASRHLAEIIPRSIPQQPTLLTSPSLSRMTMGPSKPLLQRRASTAETPCVLRRSNNSLAVRPTPPPPPQEKPSRPACIANGSNGHASSLSDPQALSKLEGVEKQLAQLVSSVEKLASTPTSSPISPNGAARITKQRVRRQLSGSYDNINEAGSNNTNSDVSVSVEMPQHPERIVVDLSNISPPYQILNGVSGSLPNHVKQVKEPTPLKENPLSVEPVLSAQTSPPPPMPPPRRRRRQDTAMQPQHHLSVAHLVLNQNELEEQKKQSPIVESATLGRASTPRQNGGLGSHQPLFPSSNAGFATSTQGHPKVGIRLQRQGSLIIPQSHVPHNGVSNLVLNSQLNGNSRQHNYPPRHHNFLHLQHQQTPLPQPNHKMALTNRPVSDGPMAENGFADTNPYASLGRFRSVAHLGQIPPTSPGVASNRDYYPLSTPTTPSGPRDQPSVNSGRSI